ncbi:putative U3 small nucleolar RNA-associated protein 11 [Dermatophagoides farinae]|uniref:U3 small nucleolar RNA-associated protein 11 n=1 Tax=Dermatophagoides farinae TaxID=6954 RepID=A0A9D4P891_DERFA|nr:probable U3 small nucleolar RNA-associated protein 11 [Dermatophagoides farinae]KAH7645857.1 putative u3 small nucleolar rna-associated protein 11 [Dermatophagoides farinae]
MSSFMKAQKSRQRLHRERVNVLDKGFLERKKDYQTRAAEYNRRKDIFTKLRKKALDKNPDEFFFRMKSSNLIDGIHYDHRKDEELSKEELQLMQTQDLNYVKYKRSIDMKKIPKLQSELHLLDPDKRKRKNKHIFFVDDKKEKKNFDIAQRMKLDNQSLNKGSHFVPNQSISDEDLLASNQIRDLKYRRLNNKIDRETLLRGVSDKMRIKKQLLNRKESAKKIKKGTNNKFPVYEWKIERKK